MEEIPKIDFTAGTGMESFDLGITLKCAETEEEFIFKSISKFCDKEAGMHLNKAQLRRAILLYLGEEKTCLERFVEDHKEATFSDIHEYCPVDFGYVDSSCCREFQNNCLLCWMQKAVKE